MRHHHTMHMCMTAWRMRGIWSLEYSMTLWAVHQCLPRLSARIASHSTRTRSSRRFISSRARWAGVALLGPVENVPNMEKEASLAHLDSAILLVEGKCSRRVTILGHYGVYKTGWYKLIRRWRTSLISNFLPLSNRAVVWLLESIYTTVFHTSPRSEHRSVLRESQLQYTIHLLIQFFSRLIRLAHFKIILNITGSFLDLSFICVELIASPVGPGTCQSPHQIPAIKLAAVYQENNWA